MRENSKENSNTNVVVEKIDDNSKTRPEIKADAIEEDPRLTGEQKQTTVDHQFPGDWTEVTSGHKRSMIKIVEDDSFTVQLVRVSQRFGQWTSVNNWEGQTITGVRAMAKEETSKQLMEDE